MTIEIVSSELMIYPLALPVIPIHQCLVQRILTHVCGGTVSANACRDRNLDRSEDILEIDAELYLDESLHTRHSGRRTAVEVAKSFLGAFVEVDVVPDEGSSIEMHGGHSWSNGNTWVLRSVG
jgi:hypothetical protein